MMLVVVVHKFSITILILNVNMWMIKWKNFWVNDTILKCNRCNNTIKCYFLDGEWETISYPNCGSNKLEISDLED